jgi:Arc/MetJ-type ribon-helix-helix transcriptional regulator
MTMLSFRVSRTEAEELQSWAERLGVDRSELLREAVRRHLVRLASQRDALTWERMPLSENERSIAEVADWGPAEDWTEWVDEAR